MSYDCFLSVRTASSRLKKKCLLSFGQYNFLEHSIKRCLIFRLNPIICTTNLKEDNLICKIAKKYSVQFFRGSSNNRIKRWYDCAVHFKLAKFHTIDVDDPFFDNKSIKKSLNFLKKYDLVFPSNKSRTGGGSEGYSIKTIVLEKILSKIKNKKMDKMNIEIVDDFFKDRTFKTIVLNNSKYETSSKFRVTLDYKEDYIFLNAIRDMVGNFSSRSTINKFLDKNKYLRKINFFRNKDWKKRQKEQSNNK